MLAAKADLLTLTAPEMTVLVGGMRAMNANAEASAHGVFTDRPGTLSNDFFVNLPSTSPVWFAAHSSPGRPGSGCAVTAHVRLGLLFFRNRRHILKA